MLENDLRRVTIEIDDEASHNKKLISSGKFYDDLLKQNSMAYLGWDVYRWAVWQMRIHPETEQEKLELLEKAKPVLQNDRIVI